MCLQYNSLYFSCSVLVWILTQKWAFCERFDFLTWCPIPFSIFQHESDPNRTLPGIAVFVKWCAVFLIGFDNHIHTAACPSLVYQTRCVDSDWLLLTIHEHIYLSDGYTDCFILEACHLKSSKFTNTCGITIRFGYKETHSNSCWQHRYCWSAGFHRHNCEDLQPVLTTLTYHNDGVLILLWQSTHLFLIQFCTATEQRMSFVDCVIKLVLLPKFLSCLWSVLGDMQLTVQ